MVVDQMNRAFFQYWVQKGQQWWRDFSHWFNGEACIIEDARHEVSLFMDALGTEYGEVQDKDWIAGAWGGSLSSSEE